MLEGFVLNYDFVLSWFLNIVGVGFIAYNNKALLYEEGKLSLILIWSWIVFFIAALWWVKYMLGVIPSGTPFPPGLEAFLFICLAYQFGADNMPEVLKLINNKFAFGSNNKEEVKDMAETKHVEDVDNTPRP